MGKVGRLYVEGCSQEERKRRRAQLGTLQSLTVQSRTRQRYNKALEQFWSFLRTEGIAVPDSARPLDRLLCVYLEHLWAEGFGRALASDTVAAIQDAQPDVRKRLPATWRLLKVWNQNEIPSRAPPLPEEALHAMVGYAMFKSEHYFALSLLVGFYGVLRTGEILELKAGHVAVDTERGPAVISLGLTKGGQRQGAAESVTVTSEQVIRWLHQWAHQASARTPLCPKPAQWRKLFNTTLEALGFSSFQFRPYSLRRGGATYWFKKWGTMDRLLVYGRWQNARTARTYVNDGLAALASMRLPWTGPNKRFKQIFLNSFHSSIPSLEPVRKATRSGGTGKKAKSKKSSARNSESG